MDSSVLNAVRRRCCFQDRQRPNREDEILEFELGSQNLKLSGGALIVVRLFWPAF